MLHGIKVAISHQLDSFFILKPFFLHEIRSTPRLGLLEVSNKSLTRNLTKLVQLK